MYLSMFQPPRILLGGSGGGEMATGPLLPLPPPSFGFGGRGRPFGDGADLGAGHLGGFLARGGCSRGGGG